MSHTDPRFARIAIIAPRAPTVSPDSGPGAAALAGQPVPTAVQRTGADVRLLLLLQTETLVPKGSHLEVTLRSKV